MQRLPWLARGYDPTTASSPQASEDRPIPHHLRQIETLNQAPKVAILQLQVTTVNAAQDIALSLQVLERWVVLWTGVTGILRTGCLHTSRNLPLDSELGELIRALVALVGPVQEAPSTPASVRGGRQIRLCPQRQISPTGRMKRIQRTALEAQHSFPSAVLEMAVFKAVLAVSMQVWAVVQNLGEAQLHLKAQVRLKAVCRRVLEAIVQVDLGYQQVLDFAVQLADPSRRDFLSSFWVISS